MSLHSYLKIRSAISRVPIEFRATRLMHQAKLNRELAMAQKGHVKFYTDQIYEYPFNYINTQKWPSQFNYRETWNYPDWIAQENLLAKWLMRMFWTFFFYQLFHDPGAVLGHCHLPEPINWTDAELGIPPDEEGTYEEWVRTKYGDDHPLTPPDDGENRGGIGFHRTAEGWWKSINEKMEK